MEEMFGLPKDIIEELEAKISSFTFDSIVERLDTVFAKGWSFCFTGPEIIDVPRQVFKYPKAKNPKAFSTQDVPHWQCHCSIEILTADRFNEISREYSVLVPVSEPSSYEVARDLSLIYTAHYGLGVGRKSKEIFEHGKSNVELEIGGPPDVLADNLKELTKLRSKLGIKTNEELNPLVLEWNSELRSYRDITKSNLREFIAFLVAKSQEKL